MTVYKWKTGARVSASAQVAGEVCAALEDEGRLTPRDLVDDSRPDDAPLHGCFEWDDAVAAEAYRESQAGHIIRSVEIVCAEVSEPVRAFMPVAIASDEDEIRRYESTAYIMETEDGRDMLLERAKRELAAFERKYRCLEELAGVIAAANQVLEVA